MIEVGYDMRLFFMVWIGSLNKNQVNNKRYIEEILDYHVILFLERFEEKNEQIDDVQNLLKRFSDYYEKEYYQNDGQQLAACKISFHYLLHVADSIKYCDPSWTYWQFPMERMCGILQLLIKSRIKPYSNLANSKERVFGIEEYREEFYSPFIQYSLPIQEYKHLVKFYEGLRNINYDVEKEVINNYGVKYGRLRTSDGQYVSSYWIKRNNKIARNNYCIQIRRMIDKVAYRPNAPSQLAIVNIYGIVNYYLVHEFNHQVYMLVYIQLTSKNIEDEYECKCFTQYRSKEFINVRCIDHCVGFAKVDNRYFIIDKENAFDDSN
ncbi:hypothetical protein GLOIN_2v1644898 [Rhizophagus clarus]|uniref:Uncharacterized protein n=1 Tax=Rhizophagus clarus TaxID=94130 RepID=A0A8H3QST8_9GLOM|nr:hypothetical protein GLOIN_2v1644898 [Rhizophagus clarus]